MIPCKVRKRRTHTEPDPAIHIRTVIPPMKPFLEAVKREAEVKRNGIITGKSRRRKEGFHEMGIGLMMISDEGRIWMGARVWIGEVLDGGLGLVDEPIDGFAGAVVAEAVLHVVELNGGVSGEAHAAVPGAFGGVHFAVAVFPASGPDNVSPFHLYYLAASRRCTFHDFDSWSWLMGWGDLQINLEILVCRKCDS